MNKEEKHEIEKQFEILLEKAKKEYPDIEGYLAISNAFKEKLIILDAFNNTNFSLINYNTTNRVEGIYGNLGRTC